MPDTVADARRVPLHAKRDIELMEVCCVHLSLLERALIDSRDVPCAYRRRGPTLAPARRGVVHDLPQPRRAVAPARGEHTVRARRARPYGEGGRLGALQIVCRGWAFTHTQHIRTSKSR